ncbi:MAG TPA: radical SAM protein [Marinospirillum sp.]|uniref:radical SAM protein n=1 Tax=Marinospirillum sp. TaxID=2183934 RepID=UPI002B4A2179|nr:radical SAM protein [Marinospirillum sp.]HKM15630.1 radical SAM protein [Marinospirillum sp.]
MKLYGHLLYIDITQICGIGCDFCMYSDKHSSGINMELSVKAKKNLAALINSPGVKRISVSGEGEPLNNYHVFHEILKLSKGGKAFEFITSGFYPHDKLENFYNETNALTELNGDTCNIRLSTDHHHIEKIKHRPHGFTVNYFFDRQPAKLSFSFRSIDSDREFTRKYLIDELKKWNLDGDLKYESILEDSLVVNGSAFGIDYKNLVYPAVETAGEFLDLQDYIAAIEIKVGKRFTLGSLNKHPESNGLDLTIKPNGDVFLYGLECERLGNIHFDSICWKNLELYVKETPLFKLLYTKPFTELINKISGDLRVPQLIKKVNNPYWLIKEMAHHDGLLENLVFYD